MTLIVTIGVPGSGKSTWAEATLEPGTLRLERDRFREAIFGTRRAYHESSIGHEQRSTLVTQAMLSAMIYWPKPEWAVTDTGLDFRAVAPFIWHAQRCAVPVRLVVFDCPWDVLVERNQTREEAHRIPMDLLQDRYLAFNDPHAWWRVAGEGWLTPEEHQRMIEAYR